MEERQMDPALTKGVPFCHESIVIVPCCSLRNNKSMGHSSLQAKATLQQKRVLRKTLWILFDHLCARRPT